MSAKVSILSFLGVLSDERKFTIRETEIIEGPLGHHLGPHSGPIVVQWGPGTNSSTQMDTQVFTLSGLWPASTALAYVRLVVTWNAP